MSQFSILMITWGIGVITGRLYQYVIDHRHEIY
jgi:hypothetical protein